jgi:hypothetical protein
MAVKTLTQKNTRKELKNASPHITGHSFMLFAPEARLSSAQPEAFFLFFAAVA